MHFLTYCTSFSTPCVTIDVSEQSCNNPSLIKLVCIVPVNVSLSQTFYSLLPELRKIQYMCRISFVHSVTEQNMKICPKMVLSTWLGNLKRRFKKTGITCTWRIKKLERGGKKYIWDWVIISYTISPVL